MNRICIIRPDDKTTSETFIQYHIDRLPGIIFSLHGGWFPTLTQDNKPLIHFLSLFDRISFKIANLLKLKPDKRFYLKALKNYLVKNEINVILAEYALTAINIMKVAKELNIPLVVHFHGFDAYRYEILNKHENDYLELFKSSAAVVVVSEDMKSQLLKLGAPTEKIFLNYYGVDKDLFKKTDILKNEIKFISVGRFVDKKSPLNTINAFKIVQEEIPDAKLIMIGDGPLLEGSKDRVSELGLKDSVIFCGALNHSEVSRLMRSSLCFVLHSVHAQDGDCEGTPNVILEASASGLPVVATRHAGIKDVVKDNFTGFLVEENDIEGMAERMIIIAKNKELAAELGSNGRAYICANHTLEISIKKLAEIIQNVQKIK